MDGQKDKHTHISESKNKKPINLDSILTPVYKSFVSELFFVIISHNQDFFLNLN